MYVAATLLVFLIATIVEIEGSETTRMVCDCRTVPPPKCTEKYTQKKLKEYREAATKNDLLVTGNYRPAKRRTEADDGSNSAALKTISGGDANSVSGVFVY